MSAHAIALETEPLGAFPAIVLVLVVVLTTLGVFAHVAFA